MQPDRPLLRRPVERNTPRRDPARRRRLLTALRVVSVAAAMALMTGSTLRVAATPTAGVGTQDDGLGPGSGWEPTTVSLTFDGGRANQVHAAQTLRKFGLRGTFFVNSGFLGSSEFMSVENLHSLVSDGHEIGGHTATLSDLSGPVGEEQARQICIDRSNLAGHGLKVTSFAYPFDFAAPEAADLVVGCGYNSARSSGGIRSRFDCPDCDVAESIRPADPFRTRSAAEVTSLWTLDDLQRSVTAAERNGGWLQLVFNDIHDSGEPRSLSPKIFDDFAAWLGSRSEQRSTAIRTVHEVIGGTVKPIVAGPAALVAPPGINALTNPGLETPGKYGLPHCWELSSYGENTYVLSTLTPGHNGAIARRLDVTGYKSGDVKLLPVLDFGDCSPNALPGHSYALSAWYHSTAPTQFALYYRNKAGVWAYWTASPWFDATASYKQARWTTPAVPEDAAGISFGLNLFSDGELATDDYGMYDAGMPPPP